MKQYLKRASQSSKHISLRGHPENCIQTILSEVTFEDRNQALRQKQNKKIVLFCNATSPSRA